MSVAVAVLAIAVLAGVAGFVASARHRLDPIDPTPEERAVARGLARVPRVQRFLRQRLDRQTRGGFLLTVAFLVVFGVALVLGLLLDMVERGSGLAEVDESVAEWGSRNATSGAVEVLEVVTDLGGTPVVFAALAATAVVDVARHRNGEVVAFLAAVGIGQLLVNNLLKLIIDRDRPDVLQLVETSGSSFPSGHSTAAAATWSAVALVLGRDRGRLPRALLAAGAVLVTVAVAASRALLGVHWVTDVVGGVAVGWGWFLLVAIAFGGRTQRLGSSSVVRVSPDRATSR